MASQNSTPRQILFLAPGSTVLKSCASIDITKSRIACCAFFRPAATWSVPRHGRRPVGRQDRVLAAQGERVAHAPPLVRATAGSPGPAVDDSYPVPAGPGPGPAPGLGREVLEDALLKISVVISDLLGVSGRRFPGALVGFHTRNGSLDSGSRAS
jgi:hypothetical protein